jgi:hypothetical protein
LIALVTWRKCRGWNRRSSESARCQEGQHIERPSILAGETFFLNFIVHQILQNYAIWDVSFALESQSLPVQHVLDVMHCEKKVTENLLKTLFREKDTPSMRIDLMNRRLRPHLHLQRIQGHADRVYMPDAPYILAADDRKLFLNTLMDLKMPSLYGSSLKSKIAKGKLSGLKSHDFYILMQDILHVCLRNVGNSRVVGIVIRLSRSFKKICSKVVNMDDREALFEDCVETLCLLEKEMPPLFFDIMVHLTIHLVEELFICSQCM